MDLKNYLTEPVQLKPDFAWWLDGLTHREDGGNYDVKKNERNPHECKDELDMQWGEGGFVITEDNNVPATKKFLDHKVATQTIIVAQVRSMMNAGAKESVIRDFLASTQKPEIIKACGQEIDRQLKLTGSVGRFVLDARGYKNCDAAMKFASKNPFKKYMKFVIGCNCGTHVTTQKSKTGSYTASESSGDAITDFLGEDSDHDKNETYQACPTTGFQVMSGQGDIDEDWAGNTMIDVMNAAVLDKEQGKSFTASNEQPYMKLKKFFIALDSGLIKPEVENRDYSEKCDDLSQAPMGIGLQQALDMGDVDMNKKDNESMIIVVPEPEVNTPVPVTNGVAGFDMQLENPETVNVELETADDESIVFKTQDLPIKESLPMNINETPMNIDLKNDNENMDIGFGINDEEDYFGGSGEVELEDKLNSLELPVSF